MAKRRRNLSGATSRQADAARLRVVRRSVKVAKSSARSGHCSAAKTTLTQALYTVEHTTAPSARRIGFRAVSKARIEVGRLCPIR